MMRSCSIRYFEGYIGTRPETLGRLRFIYRFPAAPPPAQAIVGLRLELWIGRRCQGVEGGSVTVVNVSEFGGLRFRVCMCRVQGLQIGIWTRRELGLLARKAQAVQLESRLAGEIFATWY